MNCPFCNFPNLPSSGFCCQCGAPLRPQERRPSKGAAVAKTLLLAVLVPVFYYAVMNAVSLVWIYIFNSGITSGITKEQYISEYTAAFNRDSGYLNIIFSGICVLAAAVFYALRRRSLVSAANIHSAPPLKVGAAFVCGLTLQIPVGFALALIPFSEEMLENHGEVVSACTSPMWVQLLYAVVLAPLIEEIFFRGIVHDRAARAMPLPIACVVSSLGFALIHAEPIAVLVAFACGCLLALLYSRFGTVLIPLAFHSGFNLLSFAVAEISDPLLLAAGGCLSVGLFIGSTYLLLRKDRAED